MKLSMQRERVIEGTSCKQEEKGNNKSFLRPGRCFSSVDSTLFSSSTQRKVIFSCRPSRRSCPTIILSAHQPSLYRQPQPCRPLLYEFVINYIPTSLKVLTFNRLKTPFVHPSPKITIIKNGYHNVPHVRIPLWVQRSPNSHPRS